MQTLRQLDGQDFYIGDVVGDSPGAIDAPIPVIPEGKHAKRINGEWLILDDRDIFLPDYDFAHQVFSGVTQLVPVLNEERRAQRLAEQQEREALRQKKQNGARGRQATENVMDLVAANNLAKGLTIAQLDQMEAQYPDVLMALQNNRAIKAKTLIQNLTPDGTLVTQEDKNEYLAEFASLGF